MDNIKEVIKWNNVKTLNQISDCEYPCIAKVIDGCDKSTTLEKNAVIYMQNVDISHQVVAECLLVGASYEQLPTPTGQYLSFPINYPGWFEVVSANGLEIEHFHSVRELIDDNPHQCITRSTIKAYVCDEKTQIHASNSHLLMPGEILSLVNVVSMSFVKTQTYQDYRKDFLLCLDVYGTKLLLDCQELGEFSRIATKENISGVHHLSDLIEKFSLPLTVKLLFGTLPVDVKLNSYTGILKLSKLHVDKRVFAVPFDTDFSSGCRVIPILMNNKLKLRTAQQFAETNSIHQRILYMNESIASAKNCPSVYLPAKRFISMSNSQLYDNYSLTQLSIIENIYLSFESNGNERISGSSNDFNDTEEDRFDDLSGYTNNATNSSTEFSNSKSFKTSTNSRYVSTNELICMDAESHLEKHGGSNRVQTLSLINSERRNAICDIPDLTVSSNIAHPSSFYENWDL